MQWITARCLLWINSALKCAQVCFLLLSCWKLIKFLLFFSHISPRKHHSSNNPIAPWHFGENVVLSLWQHSATTVNLWHWGSELGVDLSEERNFISIVHGFPGFLVWDLVRVLYTPVPLADLDVGTTPVLWQERFVMPDVEFTAVTGVKKSSCHTKQLVDSNSGLDVNCVHSHPFTT